MSLSVNSAHFELIQCLMFFLLHESHKNWYLKWNHPNTRDHPQLLVRFMLLMLLFFYIALCVLWFVCLSVSLFGYVVVIFFFDWWCWLFCIFHLSLIVMLYIVSNSCDSEIDVRFTTLTIVKDRIRTLYELFMFYCCISDNM